MEPASEPESRAPAPASSGRLARRLIALALATALCFVLTRGLVLEEFVVDGASMEPTLGDHDHVIVLKLVEPARGELVVFRHPTRPDVIVIKRLIATGGEVVAIRGGVLTVDGRERGEPYLVHASDRDPALDFPEAKVPEGYLFVLGDNRVASSDSRRALGFVDRRLVVGKAVLALWPLRRL